jgi:hypothetical protein
MIRAAVEAKTVEYKAKSGNKPGFFHFFSKLIKAGGTRNAKNANF